MIQSSHNVSGRSIDTPRLVVDNGHVYWGTFESPTRCIFLLPDTEDPWGATLFWGNQAQRYYYVLPETGQKVEHIPGLPESPAGAGAYEGAPMAYASAFSRLTVSADRLHLLQDGKVWTWAMMTGFCDYYLWLTGRQDQVRALWTQARDLGANGRRVFGMMKYIAPFDPREFGTAYFDQMPSFTEDAEAHGHRLHWDVFADNQVYNFGLSFWNQSVEMLRPLPSVVIGAGNEWRKNGFDPSTLPYPGVLSSQGSALADEAPPMPGWGIRAWHGRRGPYPKQFISADDMLYVALGFDEKLGQYAPPSPAAHDEPMGFAEIDIEGRRSTDPNLARTLMLTGKAYGVGCTGHFEDAIYGRLLGPIQQTCARAMYAAAKESA